MRTTYGIEVRADGQQVVQAGGKVERYEILNVASGGGPRMVYGASYDDLGQAVFMATVCKDVSSQATVVRVDPAGLNAEDALDPVAAAERGMAVWRWRSSRTFWAGRF